MSSMKIYFDTAKLKGTQISISTTPGSVYLGQKQSKGGKEQGIFPIFRTFPKFGARSEGDTRANSQNHLV